MIGALQSRMQGARPQQKPMGQPAGELAVLKQEPAVLKAQPMGQPAGGFVSQQQSMGPESEVQVARPNVAVLKAGPMGGGDDMGDIRGMSDDMRRRQEMALRNRDITQAGRPMPMQGNSFAVAPQRLDMAQRLNSMFVPRG